MPERFSKSSVHLDVAAGENPAHQIPDSDTPFQILVVADLTGRANRGLHAPLAGRRPRRVDCDNVDETIADLDVALNLPQTALRFRELDDFHPDHIYRASELFRKLEDARDHPPRESAQAPKAVAASAPPVDIPREMQPGRSLLDQMMDSGEASTPAPARSVDTLADFIQQAIAPHLEKVEPGRKQWSARVDAAAGELMRTVLHNPQFQALESAWRAVQFLVQRLNPDNDLRLFLLDATQAELLDDPQGFVKCLASSREPWAVIVGDFAFGPTAADALRLQILGLVAASAGAPILAEGQPPSDEPVDPDYAALRKSAVARWIGLALPRILLRLPYGKATSEVESFPFEEMPQSVHSNYLWGNPAYACALRLGEAFRDEGWDLRPGRGQITGMPLHTFKEDGASVNKPCAEILLSEHDAGFLMKNGLMPVASMKDQDSILVLRIQSIADPLAPLAGRWATS